MTRIRMFPLLLLTLALCACGNKGPLVHPPPPEEAPEEAPSTAAADAGAEADPVPVDDVPVPFETEPMPAEPEPVETEPATPPEDTTDDEPPGAG